MPQNRGIVGNLKYTEQRRQVFLLTQLEREQTTSTDFLIRHNAKAHVHAACIRWSDLLALIYILLFYLLNLQEIQNKYFPHQFYGYYQ